MAKGYNFLPLLLLSALISSCGGGSSNSGSSNGGSNNNEANKLTQAQNRIIRFQQDFLYLNDLYELNPFSAPKFIIEDLEGLGSTKRCIANYFDSKGRLIKSEVREFLSDKALTKENCNKYKDPVGEIIIYEYQALPKEQTAVYSKTLNHNDGRISSCSTTVFDRFNRPLLSNIVPIPIYASAVCKPEISEHVIKWNHEYSYQLDKSNPTKNLDFKRNSAWNRMPVPGYPDESKVLWNSTLYQVNFDASNIKILNNNPSGSVQMLGECSLEFDDQTPPNPKKYMCDRSTKQRPYDDTPYISEAFYVYNVKGLDRMDYQYFSLSDGKKRLKLSATHFYQ